MSSFAPLSHTLLAPDTMCEHPFVLPELVHLTDSALDVMTDFRVVKPVTVEPLRTIDAALEYMKYSGVRLLLVVDTAAHVIGIVTAKQIMGERPIKMVQEDRIPRSSITIEQIMTPRDSVHVLNYLSVRNAQIGHILRTMHELELQHMLVMEVEEGKQVLRGLFSSSQMSKQLGFNVNEEAVDSHSLAEIQRAIR